LAVEGCTVTIVLSFGENLREDVANKKSCSISRMRKGFWFSLLKSGTDYCGVANSPLCSAAVKT
jgi:hypothetical protein